MQNSDFNLLRKSRMNHLRVLKLIEDFGPPKPTKEQCDSWNSEMITKEALYIEKFQLDRSLKIQYQTTLETYGKEKAEREKGEYLNNYQMSARLSLEQGKPQEFYKDLARVDAFFPQLQIRTFGASLYEGLFSFHDGGGFPPHNESGDSALRNFIWELTRACQQN